MKKIITKSRISLNAGTLNSGFTVYGTDLGSLQLFKATRWGRKFCSNYETKKWHFRLHKWVKYFSARAQRNWYSGENVPRYLWRLCLTVKQNMLL
jgi:hypothetical protein